MKALIKTISIFAVLAVALLGFGCSSAKAPTSKAHTSVAKAAPVKEVKNDPDHIFYIYPDGTVEKQVWTGK
jgi:PBP1b-binding outer membrane lipoprotein LpoB